MPRGPRLAVPSVLPPEAGKHHVIVRRIEERAIFRDDRDRADFVAQVAALAEAEAWGVVAWVLLPNHAHLLVRTCRQLGGESCWPPAALLPSGSRVR